jgi:hypothetical protein
MGDINSRHSDRRNSQFRISMDKPGKQSNVLVKATSPKYGEFLVLNELHDINQKYPNECGLMRY